MNWEARTRKHAEPTAEASRCPGLPGHKCRRRVDPSMLVDVSGMEHALTGGADYLCDACLERLELAGRMTRADLARAQRAPAGVVAALEAKAQRRRAVDEANRP